jgi:hypothetical protein
VEASEYRERFVTDLLLTVGRGWFVSGYGFSRIEKTAGDRGFQPLRAAPKGVP